MRLLAGRRSGNALQTFDKIRKIIGTAAGQNTGQNHSELRDSEMDPQRSVHIRTSGKAQKTAENQCHHLRGGGLITASQQSFANVFADLYHPLNGDSGKYC